MNFVVDTWVLHKAKEEKREAVNMLYNIVIKHHKVFVDKGGEILTEYRSVQGVFISKWLTMISSRGIVKVKIRKRCKNILRCRKDMKFVYVCLNSHLARIIVSEDHHFTRNCDELLKKGIKLLALAEALELSSQQN